MSIYTEIQTERERQIAKFGDQSHVPSFTFQPADTGIRCLETAYLARAACEDAFKKGYGSYLHILTEEVAEAGDEARAGSSAELRKELVQVAAVCVAWIEKLDK